MGMQGVVDALSSLSSRNDRPKCNEGHRKGAAQQSSPSCSWAQGSQEEPAGVEARSQGELREDWHGWAVERGGEWHEANTQHVEPYKSHR